MNATKIVAIVLIVAGVLGLLYGGFSYNKDTTAVKVGPIELSVKETQTVNIPMWAGIGAIVVGGLLSFLVARRGRFTWGSGLRSRPVHLRTLRTLVSQPADNGLSAINGHRDRQGHQPDSRHLPRSLS